MQARSPYDKESKREEVDKGNEKDEGKFDT
jgi:hypothetical protein